jgi:hypothetical protein
MKVQFMKTHNNVVAAGALALALALPGQAQAAVGTTILTEGFDDINALAGWSQFNNSYPQGQGWFQGVAATFAAQGGAGNSYAATNFLAADAGVGSVDSWLISPVLQLTGTTVLSFFSRAAGTAGYSDQLEVRFDSGNGDFLTLLTTVGGVNFYPGNWTAYSASLTQEGSGRFAFRYLGDADALDYVGVDTVSVTTAVPEPSSWLMLVLGLAGVGALRRKFS